VSNLDNLALWSCNASRKKGSEITVIIFTSYVVGNLKMGFNSFGNYSTW
jgi:hypothetical protein